MIDIIGSGPVALASALFLRRQGIPAALIRLSPPPHQRAPVTDGVQVAMELPDATSLPALRRTLALAEGSCQLLRRIIAVPDGGMIERILVTQSDRRGRTRIHARDFQLPALGRVVGWHDLVMALETAARQQGLLPADPTTPDGSASPTGSDGPGSDGSGADGPGPGGTGLPCNHGIEGLPSPWIRLHAEGMPPPDASIERRFEQDALLLEVEATQPCPPDALHTAVECFTPHGPLALLPMQRAGHWNVVWCDRPDATHRRLTCHTRDLMAELNEQAGRFFGPLRAVSGRQQVPLVRRTRIQTVLGRDLWIGNAAQSLHPVAGQGLNLGLRDAHELARSLGDWWAAGDPQAADPIREAGTTVRQRALLRTLRQYDQARQPDRKRLSDTTDLMASSFTWPAARPIQDRILDGLDSSAFLRRPLARRLLFGVRH